MRIIPIKHKKIISEDPYFKICTRSVEGTCQGKITIEHALIFGGRQISEIWNYIPLCAFHHAVDEFQDGGDLQKEKNVWLALNRANDDELRSVSKAVDYLKMRDRLNKKYI